MKTAKTTKRSVHNWPGLESVCKRLKLSVAEVDKLVHDGTLLIERAADGTRRFDPNSVERAPTVIEKRRLQRLSEVGSAAALLGIARAGEALGISEKATADHFSSKDLVRLLLEIIAELRSQIEHLHKQNLELREAASEEIIRSIASVRALSKSHSDSQATGSPSEG